MAAAAAAFSVSACGDGGTQPGTLRFGQIGEVRLQLSSPLLLGQGQLQQSLTWNSSGPWQLTEAISYRPAVAAPDAAYQPGADHTRRSVANPDVLASDYAVWITQVNELPSLQLFIPELDPSLDPECGVALTKITLVIRDAVLNEERSWVRCAEGTLASLVTAGAGPDAAAARVANAAILLRDYAFPGGFLSTFHGSFPFATLARGDDTPVPLDTPWVIDSPQTWTQFWTSHTGSAEGLPLVDFGREVVLVAAIGQRFETGETVGVRRVLPVGEGTLVQTVWRVPGNFCSPVARTQRPFHVVVAPQVPRPITFAQVQREEVPCGGP